MAIDWTDLVKKYHGQWVALKDDEKTVIASGKTAQEAYKKALATDYKEPILAKIPSEVMTYVGSHI